MAEWDGYEGNIYGAKGTYEIVMEMGLVAWEVS